MTLSGKNYFLQHIRKRVAFIAAAVAVRRIAIEYERIERIAFFELAGLDTQRRRTAESRHIEGVAKVNGRAGAAAPCRRCGGIRAARQNA